MVRKWCWCRRPAAARLPPRVIGEARRGLGQATSNQVVSTVDLRPHPDHGDRGTHVGAESPVSGGLGQQPMLTNGRSGAVADPQTPGGQPSASNASSIRSSVFRLRRRSTSTGQTAVTGQLAPKLGDTFLTQKQRETG